MTPNDETSLDDVRKDKNSLGVLAQRLGRW